LPAFLHDFLLCHHSPAYNHGNWKGFTRQSVMLAHAARLILLPLLLAATASASECVAFSDAHEHIGSTRCVSGKIFNVKEGTRGVTFLDFCENFDTCPFTVVVFADDLKHVGDVRQLKGRSIEISGKVVQYDGRAEIVLSRPKQLGKDAILIPPLPKNYDVERRGNFSPGKFRAPKQKTAKIPHKQGHAVDIEDPSDNP
jgi:hypothetical protein